jgi:hypothetical protein
MQKSTPEPFKNSTGHKVDQSSGADPTTHCLRHLKRKKKYTPIYSLQQGNLQHELL